MSTNLSYTDFPMQSAAMKTFCETGYGSLLPADVQELVGKMLAEQVLKEVTANIESSLFMHILD